MSANTVVDVVTIKFIPVMSFHKKTQLVVAALNGLMSPLFEVERRLKELCCL